MEMERYSMIEHKNPREIVLLKGLGCGWKKCTFCDYHLDASQNQEENYKLNCQVLNLVTGIYHHLEVINSGSFLELDKKTMERIIHVCKEKNIKKLHFECHWIYRNQIFKMRKKLKEENIELKVKTGVESFQMDFREKVLKKGIDTNNPEEIAKYFDEICLLQGITGQTVESMIQDIKTGLAYFERVCVNIMIENGTKIKPNAKVIKDFMNQVYPLYVNCERVDILLNNTDFGVGDTANMVHSERSKNGNK